MKKVKRISAALMVILLAGLFTGIDYPAECSTGGRADGSYFLYRVYFRIVLCYGADDTGVKTQ